MAMSRAESGCPGAPRRLRPAGEHHLKDRAIRIVEGVDDRAAPGWETAKDVVRITSGPERSSRSVTITGHLLLEAGRGDRQRIDASLRQRRDQASMTAVLAACSSAR